jgi:DNA-binding transcriptional LysR family regulator
MLPSSLDIRQLECLVALVTERSVTRAAERMSMSQPRMSNVLARLRRICDDPLLVRSGQHLAPTARALELCAAVQASLAALSEALAQPAEFDPARDSRTFVLAMSDYVSQMLLPGLMAELAAAPGVRILVKGVEPTQIDRWLDDDECQLAFGFLTHLNERLRASVLFHDRAVCIARRGHPGVADALTLQAYLQSRHVVTSGTPTPVSTLEQILEATLAEQGLRRTVAAKVAGGQAIAETVAATDLIATLPRRAALRYAAGLPLQLLEPPFRVTPFDVSMVWHERAQRDAAHAWLRRRLRAVARRNAPPP